MLRDFVDDLRSALRSLRREPVFVLMAVLTLAVGVGSTATVFGMVNQLLLRPLSGVRDPDRAAYVELHGYRRASGPDTVAGFLRIPELDELRHGAGLLSGIASYAFGGVPQVSAGGGPATRVPMSEVYGDYFGVLGVHAAEGRLLRADEGLADPRIAVIGQELRAELFGDAKNVVGRTITVDGQSVTVIGVSGGGFQGAYRTIDIQMWLPLSAVTVFNGFSSDDLMSRANVGNLVVRLRPGVRPEAAQAQMRARLEGMARTHPDDAARLKDVRPVLSPGLPLSPQSAARISGSLALFGGIVGLVLLIACANVATLLLMRNVTRRGAIATRRALGASPGRIARRHLTESALLAALGTGVGLGIAWLVGVLFHGQRIARGMLSFSSFAVDARVLAFAVAASVVTLVVFGAVPAMLAGRFDLGATLQAAGSRESKRMASVRRLMSIGQVAVSITLLAGAALLVRTVHNLYAIDTGLAIDGVSTLYLGSPAALGASTDFAGASQNVIEAVDRVAGVQSAALAMDGPLARPTTTQIALPQTPEQRISIGMRPVTPGWFTTMGLGMVSGQPFGDGDWQPGAPTVPTVLTACLARRLFGRTDVVGRSILVDLGEMQEATVVGVSRDMHMPDAPGRPLNAFFVPLASFPPRYMPGVTLVVRAHSLGAATASGIQKALESVLPNPVPPGLTPVTDTYAQIFAQQRIFSRLLQLLSLLAVVLASVGLYSVIASSVAQRRREFGIRMALGAEGTRIARLVFGDAGTIVGVGTAAGLVGAYTLSILLASRLYRVPQIDPLSYGGAVLLFAAVAALACWVPARSATRADPVETLREE